MNYFYTFVAIFFLATKNCVYCQMISESTDIQPLNLATLAAVTSDYSTTTPTISPPINEIISSTTMLSIEAAVDSSALPSSTISEAIVDSTPLPPSKISETATDSTTFQPTVALPVVPENGMKVVETLSERIRNVLKQVQSMKNLPSDNQGQFEDPLAVPPKNVSLGIVSGEFYDVFVYGLSNFTVEGVNTVLDQMEVYTVIRMEKIYIVGNCSVDTFIGFKTHGPFNITLNNVTAEGTVYLAVLPDGTLVANKTISDMTYENLVVATSAGGVLQGALSGAGIAILAALKPYMLQQIDEHITQKVNTQLVTVPKMPALAQLSPIDLAILEGHRYVAENYEPYTIQKALEHNSQFLQVVVGPVTIKGLSKFSRVGNVNVKWQNQTVVINLRMITGVLKGKANFIYDFGKIKGTRRDGLAYFTISHLQFEARINQSTNLNIKPILDNLQLQTGQIFVNFDGKGKFDYFIELIVRKLPTLLRHLVIDALEDPIKQKIQQEILNNVDVEDLIIKKLPLVESILINPQ